KRFAVLQQVIDGSRSQGQAALALGLSERQIRRLQRGVEREGARALISRRRGRPSNRRVETTVREGILAQVRARYADFGPTLAAEYLRADGYTVSKETLRRWMIAAGLWQAQRKRRTRLHPPRPRRARLGELIQIDGSPHDWFEGRGPRCTLIAFIDDATSRVLYARF
ncbi:helix-turn-helix domain-containing protein, partial [Acidithiobacillus sp. CV18-2]